jgi:hypothetical protein
MNEAEKRYTFHAPPSEFEKSGFFEHFPKYALSPKRDG